jgi:hypothetical protein
MARRYVNTRRQVPPDPVSRPGLPAAERAVLAAKLAEAGRALADAGRLLGQVPEGAEAAGGGR